jgi:hypothetical protein
MATLIPAIGSCVSRMTSGERRFAYRLEDKLEDDYLCWYHGEALRLQLVDQRFEQARQPAHLSYKALLAANIGP